MAITRNQKPIQTLSSKAIYGPANSLASPKTVDHNFKSQLVEHKRLVIELWGELRTALAQSVHLGFD